MIFQSREAELAAQIDGAHIAVMPTYITMSPRIPSPAYCVVIPISPQPPA